MIVQTPRARPQPWRNWRPAFRRSWLTPFAAVEWCFDWLAYLLSHWSFLDVLEYLGSFSVLVAVIFYFSESGDRLKQKHYQAWQVINTAQGKGGGGGGSKRFRSWTKMVFRWSESTSQERSCRVYGCHMRG